MSRLASLVGDYLRLLAGRPLRGHEPEPGLPGVERPMTVEQHRRRHVALHRALDELAADYLAHVPGSLPSRTSVIELLEWSHGQCQQPTEEGGG